MAAAIAPAAVAATAPGKHKLQRQWQWRVTSSTMHRQWRAPSAVLVLYYHHRIAKQQSAPAPSAAHLFREAGVAVGQQVQDNDRRVIPRTPADAKQLKAFEDAIPLMHTAGLQASDVVKRH